MEIKLGGEQAIEIGVASLQALGGKIDTKKMKSPIFLVILAWTRNFVYSRADGAYVEPIGCLKGRSETVDM